MKMIKRTIPALMCTPMILLGACGQSEPTPKADAPQQVIESNKAPEIKSAALVSGIDKANVDENVRPQDNFYRHVNGAWLVNNEIPSDKTSIGSFYDLRDDADENVKAIIESVSAAEGLTKGSDEQRVADLFRSFMDTDALEAAGTKPLAPILAQIDALETKSDLARFFGKNGYIGFTNPLGVWVGVDAKDSTRYATHVWQGGLGLPDQDYYVNDGERFQKLRAGYVVHIEKMAG